MLRRISHIFIIVSCMLNHTSLLADTSTPLQADNNYDAIGEHIVYLSESEKTLNFEQARNAYSSGQFKNWGRSVLSLGIGAAPQWISFTIQNNELTSVKRRLSIRASWLDYVDFYIVKDGGIVQQQKTGDRLPYNERPVNHRFFKLDHDYTPGLTQVFIRIETPDPMVLPIAFNDIESAHAEDVFNGYSYGLLYGTILALLLYNLSLYSIINQRRYLYYVLYLTLFLLMNISYTGHGYGLFWPDLPQLQRWINPFSIALFATSGIVFAFSFLKIKILFPRLYSKTVTFIVLFWVLQTLFMILNMQTASVAVAIAFVMFFSVFTFYAAIISLKKGHNDAVYYLVATIATLFGSVITACSVWAVIPYTTLSYRAAEIAVSIDALLLSIALAEQIRRAHREKNQAQQLARIDLLTNLKNRRAFSESSASIWHNAIRHNHELCIILLDIDQFKKINDTYGHAVGDTVLKETANILNKIVRKGDVLARWGGEEFIILLPQTTIKKATIIAERIRNNIAVMQLYSGDQNFSITASLGIARKDRDTIIFDELFDIADSCLYHAKQSGRNQVCSDLEHHEQEAT